LTIWRQGSSCQCQSFNLNWRSQIMDGGTTLDPTSALASRI
jgi:hypothetical protein